MIKRRWWPVFMLSLGLVAVACGSEEPTGTGATTTVEQREFPAGSTMAKIQQRGKLIVGTKFDQPLFGLKDPTTGDVKGFDAEIAKLIAKRIGPNVEVEFVEAVSKNREPFLQNGTVDMVVATYTINDARKQVVDFAGPYFVAHQDIMVKADNDEIKSVDDLNGKKVCSAQGSVSLTNVQARAPRADTSVTFDAYSKCAEALGDGRVEAVTTDDALLLGLVSRSDGAYKLVGAPFTDEPLGIGVKKGDDAFREFLNDVLEETYESGEWEEAHKDTLGTVTKETPKPPKVDRYPGTGA